MSKTIDRYNYKVFDEAFFEALVNKIAEGQLGEKIGQFAAEHKIQLCLEPEPSEKKVLGEEEGVIDRVEAYPSEKLKTVRVNPNVDWDRYNTTTSLFHTKNLIEVNERYFEQFPLIWHAIKAAAIKTQAPGWMIVNCALAIFANVAQGLFDVYSPATGNCCPLSLNAVVVAESGLRKTTVETEFNQFVEDFYHLVNSVIAELSDQEPLIAIYDDFTIEGMLLSLYKNMPVVSVMTSEGAHLMNRSNAKLITYLNKLWDGKRIAVTRATQQSFVVSNARLSSSVMIHNDVIEKILKKRSEELRSSGYLARSLFCYPRSNFGERPVFAAKNRVEAKDQLNQRLLALLFQLLHALAKPEFKRQKLVLDQEAEHIWFQFANYVEHGQAPGGIYEHVRDHASKLSENVLRVAGVLHVVEFGKGEISAKTLDTAIFICMQFSNNYMQWFVPEPQDVQTGKRLEKYLYYNRVVYLQDYNDGQVPLHLRLISNNSVLQTGPMKNAEEQNMALGYLQRQGLVSIFKEVRPKQGGKPAVYIDLMPHIGMPPMSPEGWPLQPVMLG